MTEPIMEAENPAVGRAWPYTVTLVLIPGVAIVSVVALVTLRPGQENASFVAQILGFAVTITMATLAYLKSSETREIVNSRMDEFKRTLQVAATAAQVQAHADGRAEGRAAADLRTDTLADRHTKE